MAGLCHSSWLGSCRYSPPEVHLHHERWCVMLGLKIMRGCWVWCLLGAAQVHAGQYQLLMGQAQSVPIAAQVRNNEAQCHLQLQVSGQPPIEREVKAPLYETRLVIRPEQVQPVQVRWIGTSKRNEDGLVNACPTEGETEFAVVSSNDAVLAQWRGLFDRLGPSMTACIRSALDVQQVRHEWFDLRSNQTSGEDAKINLALQQCEVFLTRTTAWGAKDPARHACVLSGLKTECEGYYAEPSAKGPVRIISQQQAIARQLQGLPWTTGVREQATARNLRLKREQAEQLRLQAIETARLEAEAKQLRDEQARQEAEAKALADKAEAEKAQEAEQKAQEEKERLEKRSWFAKTYDDLKEKVGKGGK